VREVGGDKVGVVPVDVAKQRVCAMVTDFYGTVLVPPELFAVTAAGLALLEQRIARAQREQGHSGQSSNLSLLWERNFSSSGIPVGGNRA
jgi:hypothetical protein